MPRLRTFVLALLALMAVAAPTAAPAKGTPKPTCARKHSTTLAANAVARVFTRPGGDGYNDGTDLLGCSKATGRVRSLFFAFDDDYVSSADFGLVRLSGEFAAFYAQSYDISCKASCDPGYEPYHRSVNVVDLRTGAQAGARIAERPAGNRLLLDARGAIAWPRWLPANQVEIRALDASGEHVIDSGAIHPESLVLTRGGRLSWINEATPRTTLLKHATV
jgi:hypothetical protein